ncbi:hypothetical protein LINPERHAP2_LOCUS528, partial [Linum perenne]
EWKASERNNCSSTCDSIPHLFEEGYDDPKVQTEGETIMLGERKPRSREVTDILTADTVFEKSVATAGNGSRRKRGRPRKNRAKDSDPIFAAI